MRIQKKRPKIWLSNAIEKQLETIQIQLEEFKKNPNYINKEKLISTINSYDIDQSINEGWNRTTNYEGYIVNSLYFDAMDMEFIELKNYLYKWFEAKMRLKKAIPNIDIENLEDLDALLPWAKTLPDDLKIKPNDEN